MDYIQINTKPINTPIEFKEVNPEDFKDDYIIEGGNKVIISPDDNGYIGEQLRSLINLQDKNTVVINAGVGQGKSSECINIAIEYINQKNENGENDFVVIFVAPFVNLINQYEKRLLNQGIEQESIFNYSNLTSNADIDVEFASRLPIHILTINTLIGDPGEDGFIQSRIKRQYIPSIIENCHKKRKKVVFIFDEIHESIDVFKEKYVFNLWKWYHVLHKSFILSATYSESAKIVIKYLAELTNDKIQIIESERVKIPHKQSRLHLCLNNQYKYTGEDQVISYLVEQECKKGKAVHILTFSETLADDISLPVALSDGTKVYSKVGKILSKYFGDINLCTGDTKNHFNELRCNVGTTFKTGISIENANVSLFIIMPHLGVYNMSYNKGFGIFTDGINSVIQSIARVRNSDNNDIFIVMPTPKKLISKPPEDIIVDNYLVWTTNVPDFARLKKTGVFADYFPLTSQVEILKEFYGGVICDYAELGIHNFNARYMNEGVRSETKPRLLFTNEQEFVLEDGNRFLASGYEIFGSDISAYLVWAAFNNQFENTTLQSVYFEGEILLKQGQIIEGLFAIFFKRYYFPYNFEYIAEMTLYKGFYEYVTKRIRVSVLTEDNQKIPAVKSPQIRVGIITIVQHLKRNNKDFNKRIYPLGKTTPRGKVRKAHDVFITKEMYLVAAMSNSISLHVPYSLLDGAEKFKVDGYRQLFYLANDLKKIIVFKDENELRYIPKKGQLINRNLIPDELTIGLFSAIKLIRDNDTFINDDTFSFCQWADKISLNAVQDNEAIRQGVSGKIIDEIRKLFFLAEEPANTSARTLHNELGTEYRSSSKPYEITKETSFDNINAVNVIYTSNYPWLESAVSEEFLIAIS